MSRHVSDCLACLPATRQGDARVPVAHSPLHPFHTLRACPMALSSCQWVTAATRVVTHHPPGQARRQGAVLQVRRGQHGDAAGASNMCPGGRGGLRLFEPYMQLVWLMSGARPSPAHPGHSPLATAPLSLAPGIVCPADGRFRRRHTPAPPMSSTACLPAYRTTGPARRMHMGSARTHAVAYVPCSLPHPLLRPALLPPPPHPPTLPPPPLPRTALYGTCRA